MEILKKLWEVILQDFIIKLLKLKDLAIGQKYDSILVIINKLTKWGYFIPCTEEILAENLSEIYIREVFIKHRALVKIILN